MKLTRASYKAIKYACLHFHYAKSIPVNTIGYNVFNNENEWCGVILYGSGANYKIGSEYGLLQGQVLELVRVALNGKQELTSQALAMSLKMIKNDCPLCQLIVSYADSDQDHLGTIYQATNWIYTGKVGEKHTSAFLINGEKKHGKTIYGMINSFKPSREGMTIEEILKENIQGEVKPFISKGKQKYLMPLNKRMRAKILPLSVPYPKNEEYKRLTRDEYKEKYSKNNNS